MLCRACRNHRGVALALGLAAVVVGLILWNHGVPDGAAAEASAGRAGAARRPAAADQASVPFTVAARKYAFSPARIEVQQNDLVRITLEAEDIPHSFAVDEYRIAKRAAPGQPVVFEFRADQAGTFPFYCNLSIDEGCRKMRGELVVHAKRP